MHLPSTSLTALTQLQAPRGSKRGRGSKRSRMSKDSLKSPAGLLLDIADCGGALFASCQCLLFALSL